MQTDLAGSFSTDFLKTNPATNSTDREPFLERRPSLNFADDVSSEASRFSDRDSDATLNSPRRSISRTSSSSEWIGPAVLPLVTFELKAKVENNAEARFVVRRRLGESGIETLYQRDLRAGEQTGLLEAFENFILQLDGSALLGGVVVQPLRLYLWSDPDDLADFELDVEYPMVFTTGSRIEGLLRIRASQTVTLESMSVHSLDLQAPRLCTQGIVTVKQAQLVVHDLELHHPIRATQDLLIRHGGGEFLIDDQSQAQGILSIEFANPHTLQRSFHAVGSLDFSLASTVQTPWFLLWDQSAAQDLQIRSPVPLQIGDADHAVSLHAKQGHLYLETQGSIQTINRATQQEQSVGILFLKGCLLGAASITCRSQSAISLGYLTPASEGYLKVEQLPPIMREGIKSLGPVTFIARSAEGQRQAMWWHQLAIECEDLRLFGSTLDNVSSEVQVKGNAFWDLDSSEHRALLKKKNGSMKI